MMTIVNKKMPFAIFLWDADEQPDMQEIADYLDVLSGAFQMRARLYVVPTEPDHNAVVIGPSIMADEDAQRFYNEREEHDEEEAQL